MFTIRMSAETELELLRLPEHVRARVKAHVRELAELVSTVPASYTIVGAPLLHTAVAGHVLEYEIDPDARVLLVNRIHSRSSSAA